MAHTNYRVFKASNVAQTGSDWVNVADCFDESSSSYAYRNAVSGTSASHINAFNVEIPTYYIIDSVEVWSDVYASNARGYIAIYLYSNTGTTIGNKIIANGASVSRGYVSQTYTATEIQNVLVNNGIYDGNILKYLIDGLRIRFVFGSVSSILSKAECRVYDNYVKVNYTVPDYTITVNAGEGGKVTGGGSYEADTSVTITAEANTGYKFVKWSDGNTNASRAITVTGNATYTAIFEADKINKIYVGTQQPKSIYVGTSEVKAVYVGTTKVYG